MNHGALLRTRLGRLVWQRLANDLAALALASLALAGFGALIVAVLFWTGWVLLGVLVPVAVLAWHWLRGSGLAQTAYEVEERFPEVKGRLVAALELARYDAGSRERYSTELVEAAVQQVEALVRPLALGRLVRISRLAWSTAGLGAGSGSLNRGGRGSGWPTRLRHRDWE
jgi:hypothetical protein